MSRFIQLFEVGGCVRDGLLDPPLPTKDIDFAVQVSDYTGRLAGLMTLDQAYYEMRYFMEDAGFEIFKEDIDFGVIRARFPKGTARGNLTADFVLCRKDGPSSDGRRPDYVDIGTLADDLARRDFTVNAMARAVDPVTFADLGAEIIDPHGGQNDLRYRTLRFVGDPMTRLREDGLRALRAIRFKITKGFQFDHSTMEALCDPETPTLLGGVAVERRREELERCFHHDTLGTLDLLNNLPPELLGAIFTGNLRLSATQKRDVAHR